jgi:hypothetical protein
MRRVKSSSLGGDVPTPSVGSKAHNQTPPGPVQPAGHLNYIREKLNTMVPTLPLGFPIVLLYPSVVCKSV